MKKQSQPDAVQSVEALSVISLFFIAFSLLAHRRIFLLCALLPLLLVVFFRQTAYRAGRYWLQFAKIFGSIVEKIVLTSFYFLLFTPWAAASRLFRNRKSPTHPTDSRWQHPTAEFTKEDFEKTW